MTIAPEQMIHLALTGCSLTVAAAMLWVTSRKARREDTDSLERRISRCEEDRAQLRRELEELRGLFVEQSLKQRAKEGE